MRKWATLWFGLAAVLVMPLAHAQGTVARSIVTTSVVDREPTNDLTAIPAGEERVLFFTELRGMAGQTIKHRWMHAGEQIADVDFNVGGPRWRVWSSKNMMPGWQGDWTVQVIDAAGQVIAEKRFSYGSAEEQAPKPGMQEKSDAPAGADMAAPEAPLPATESEPDPAAEMPAE